MWGVACIVAKECVLPWSAAAALKQALRARHRVAVHQQCAVLRGRDVNYGGKAAHRDGSLTAAASKLICAREPRKLHAHRKHHPGTIRRAS